MIPMDPLTAELVLKEYRRRSGSRVRPGGLRGAILGALFDKQREFVLDPSLAKTVICERRAGKTVGIVGLLLLTTTASQRGGDALYLNPTAKQAQAVMWEGSDGLKSQCRKLGIAVHADNQRMILTMPTGNKIFVGGAENREDIEAYRGRKFKVVVVDEAGSFKPHLEALVVQVLQPTLLDLGGALVLAGTPPAVLAGLFYDTIRDDGMRNKAYSMFRWSIFDNPYIDDPGRFHEWVLATNGWTRQHPVFQREYLGLCVRDQESLVYPNYRRTVNGYDAIPGGHEMLHILAIDLGYNDETAFRVVSFSPSLPDVYLARHMKKAGMSVTPIAETIKAWDSEFGFVTVVADTGGGGKQIVAELNERHGLAVVAADKAKKQAYIQALNDDVAAGHVKVRADDAVLGEWEKLQWNEVQRLKSGEIVTVKIEDPRLPNHLSDATLYGWRESRHFLFQPSAPAPRPGSAGWADAEAERMEAELLGRLGAAAEEHWWEAGAGHEMLI